MISTAIPASGSGPPSISMLSSTHEIRRRSLLAGLLDRLGFERLGDGLGARRFFPAKLGANLLRAQSARVSAQKARNGRNVIVAVESFDGSIALRRAARPTAFEDGRAIGLVENLRE